MIRLPDSLKAWGSPAFRTTLLDELKRHGAGVLPLQQGLSHSSHALEDDYSLVLLGSDDAGGRIRARIGVFYLGIVAGCNCADDPTPVEPLNEYCEVSLAIDKATAETTVGLVPD